MMTFQEIQGEIQKSLSKPLDIPLYLIQSWMARTQYREEIKLVMYWLDGQINFEEVE